MSDERKKRPIYFTPNDLIERWPGVSITGLAHWRAKGFGPSYLKIARKIYYLEESVIAFEQEYLSLCSYKKGDNS